ncbi:hypothetical protein EHS13_30070 [Paenibacillus psychroresistens]|uniref:Protein kinase domain-containing protein n=1 Tax=Paenibacillus psychroresistens TaxID=1778678 RepID=A0A6B8RSN3_9BACL|nr:hypothetical protein [Paenibacillus psychroresistens]QGQ98824.1 hypothetical protein EHS13_30070 [Paenibacillus psychroresistens]
MGFQPSVNEKLVIDGETYTIGEHPNARGVPYGQEGRQGTVYLMNSEHKTRKKAIKVFRAKFVNPSMVYHAKQLAKFRDVVGLAACQRFVVTPQNTAELLMKEPDLLYAVVMPWIDGPTWMDIILNKVRLSKKQSYKAAFALAEILAAMEQRGLAHCDLSAPNLILPMLSEDISNVKSEDYVQLIDLEQIYSTQFERPDYVPAGSPGYAAHNGMPSNEMWSAFSDRFSGAVLLMEMLGSCTDTFVDHAFGESFFAPNEVKSNCERYHQLINAIRPIWGDTVVTLFASAWESEGLTQCPTFGEWLIAISKIKQPGMEESLNAPVITETNSVGNSKKGKGSMDEDLFKQAKEYELIGDYKEAIRIYRSIQSRNLHTSLAKEIEIAINLLETSRKNNKKQKTNSAFFQTIGRLITSRKMKKVTVFASLIIVIGLIGFFSYSFIHSHTKLFTAFKSSTTAKPTQSSSAADPVLESLKKQLAEKNKQIDQLTEQLKQLKKPQSQKTKEVINQLNKDYIEIKRIANLDPQGNSNLEKQTLDASVVYLNHFFDFVKNSFDLDQHFDKQTTLVEGYYFPYIYNDGRNSQLNLQFFKDYKKKF